MSATCVGGREKKLVEARFVRDLDRDERERLERHLTACSACSERYRRLQLAHRVAALGPERALDEPAPLELERIARDLGLEDPPKRRFSFLADTRFFAAAAAAAIGLAAAVFVVPERDGELVARGGRGVVSFSAFIVSPGGAIRAHAAGRPAKTTEYLKLRVELAGGVALDGVAGFGVAIVPAAGEPRVSWLEVPEKLAAGAASIPGAIALDLPPGRAVVYAIADKGGLDRAKVDRVVAARPAADDVAEALGSPALAVDRFELALEAPAP